MKRECRYKAWLLGFILLMTPMLLTAQDAGEYIRKGNRLYKKGEFSGSEAMYRRAGNQEKEGDSAPAVRRSYPGKTATHPAG